MKGLSGHVSAETAHVDEDYPFGFRLRCKRKTWIETAKNGSRFCYQTTNPRKSFEVWNAPKKSTYSEVMVLTQNDDPASEEFGYISHESLSMYDSAEKIQAFAERWESVLTDKDRDTIKVMLAVKARQAKQTYTITVSSYTGSVLSREKMAIPHNPPLCDSPDGTCINHGACNEADECIRPLNKR